MTYTAVKLSVLFLYRRIFGVGKTFRKVNDILIYLVIIWGILFFFLDSFICLSDQKYSLSCSSQEWALLWFGITEVLGDIAILSLPYPMIRKLHKSNGDKIGIAAIFALGTL